MAKGDLLKRLALSRLERRTPLYRWLYENYDELRPALTSPRPSWDALARTAAAAGIKTASDRVPSRQAVWKAWKRVAADTAAQAAAQRAAQPASRSTADPGLMAPPLSAGPAPPPAAIVAMIDPDAPRPRQKGPLKFARPLAPGEAPTPDGSALPAPFHPNLKKD
jgi:hypothetical protein